MTHETAVSRAREIADGVLTPTARQSDKAGHVLRDFIARAILGMPLV